MPTPTLLIRLEQHQPGILGFTKSVALENTRHGFTVNAVALGCCDTAMVAAVRPDVLQSIVAGIPVGRIGSPEDIGQLVAFLADHAAGSITGATSDVNGGQYLA
jgi:acetoacetyl-CoA reductase